MSRQPPSGPRPWLLLAVLGAGFTAGMIPAGLVPANVLNIERAYGLSHSESGRLISLCMMIGGGSGGLISGWVCGHIGAIRTMLIALVLAALGLGMVGIVPVYAGTAAGLAVFYFSAGFLGSANALAARMYPRPQRGVTLLHGVNAAGKFFGPLLASLFLYGAWRMGFAAAALLPLLLLIPAFVSQNYADPDIGRRSSRSTRPAASVWISLLGFAAIAGGEMAVALWLPAYGQRVLEFSASAGNALLAVFLVGLSAGRLAASAMSHSISPRRTIAVCGLLLLAVGPALVARSFVGAALAVFALGLAFSAIWPSYFAVLSVVHREHLGLLSGTAVFANQVGFAVCAYISGLLADVDLRWPIIFGVAIMALFVSVFFLTLGRRSDTFH